MERSQLLLDRALELDPQFARAYGMKARIHALGLVDTVYGPAVARERRPALVQQIRQLVARALELDPDDRDAAGALRLVDLFTWKWSTFEQPFEPPIEPERESLWVLCWMGRHADALRRGETVAELNPRAVNAHFQLGVAQAYAGERRASITSVSRALELAPGNPLGRVWLAYNALALGDAEGALADLRLVERLLGDAPPLAFLPELAYAYARLEQADDAWRLYEKIQALDADFDVGAGSWALAYLAIGEESQALAWLEIAADRARNHEPDPGFYSLMNLKMNFLADPRLEEPPFADVLARIRGG